MMQPTACPLLDGESPLRGVIHVPDAGTCSMLSHRGVPIVPGARVPSDAGKEVPAWRTKIGKIGKKLPVRISVNRNL